jgi:Flp pilus assembly protein TadG
MRHTAVTGKVEKRRGFAVLEFTLVALPVIFLTVSIIEASLAMWQYHTMAYAVDLAARYVVVHGRGCTQNGNTCSVTLGNVAHLIAQQSVALDASKLNVTLTTHSGPTTCNPLNTCFTSTTQFPSATDNGVNLDVTIAATYPISNPMPMFWPGAGTSSIGAFTLGATSRQRILF